MPRGRRVRIDARAAASGGQPGHRIATKPAPARGGLGGIDQHASGWLIHRHSEPTFSPVAEEVELEVRTDCIGPPAVDDAIVIDGDGTVTNDERSVSRKLLG